MRPEAVQVYTKVCELSETQPEPYALISLSIGSANDLWQIKQNDVSADIKGKADRVILRGVARTASRRSRA